MRIKIFFLIILFNSLLIRAQDSQSWSCLGFDTTYKYFDITYYSFQAFDTKAAVSCFVTIDDNIFEIDSINEQVYVVWSTDSNHVCEWAGPEFFFSKGSYKVISNQMVYRATSNNKPVFYSDTIRDLKPNTTYYCKIYVRSDNIVEGYWDHSIKRFHTLPAPPPIRDNVITSQNKLVCPSLPPGELIYFTPALHANVPTGGTGDYIFIWQMKSDLDLNWKNCYSGSMETYAPPKLPCNNMPYSKVAYRRIIQSGDLSDTSNSVSFVYLPVDSVPSISVEQVGYYKNGMELAVNVNNDLQSYSVSWTDSIIASNSTTLISDPNNNSLVINLSSQSPSHIYTANVNFGGTCPVFNSKKIYISPPDGDGNYYPAVKIGNQIWMINNLRTTRFNDGSSLPMTANGTLSYSWYANDSLSYSQKFGALYDVQSISTQSNNVCPSGWKVAGTVDWFEMINTIGGTKTAGLLLKSPNNWRNNNYKGVSCNFNALPAGLGLKNNSFEGKNVMAAWWARIPNSISPNNIYNNALIQIIENDDHLYLITPAGINQSNSKYSVRCFTR